MWEYQEHGFIVARCYELQKHNMFELKRSSYRLKLKYIRFHWRFFIVVQILYHFRLLLSMAWSVTKLQQQCQWNSIYEENIINKMGPWSLLQFPIRRLIVRWRGIWCQNIFIAFKFDRHLGSCVAEVSVKLQGDQTILDTNLAVSRHCEILQSPCNKRTHIKGPAYQFVEFLWYGYIFCGICLSI